MIRSAQKFGDGNVSQVVVETCSKLANLVTDMQLNYNACLISLPLTNHAAFMVNI